jgi:hypothetical protein
MQLELPKPLYHSNHNNASTSCLHQPSNPQWLVHRPQYPPRIEIMNRSKVGLKFHCSSCWLSKSMQLELPKPSYHSNHKTSSTSCPNQPSSQPWLVHRPQPTTYWNHELQLSRAKIALQFILTIKVNAFGTAKTFISLQSQYSCLNQPSSQPWLVHGPQPTTHWNHEPKQSRAEIALQFILTIKVNANGTAKTFISLQSQDFFHFLSESAFQSPVTRP